MHGRRSATRSPPNAPNVSSVFSSRTPAQHGRHHRRAIRHLHEAPLARQFEHAQAAARPGASSLESQNALPEPRPPSPPPRAAPLTRAARRSAVRVKFSIDVRVVPPVDRSASGRWVSSTGSQVSAEDENPALALRRRPRHRRARAVPAGPAGVGGDGEGVAQAVERDLAPAAGRAPRPDRGRSCRADRREPPSGCGRGPDRRRRAGWRTVRCRGCPATTPATPPPRSRRFSASANMAGGALVAVSRKKL